MKIDIREILLAHFKSLRDGASRSLSDWVVFLVLPLFISLVLVYLGAYMSDSILSIIVSGLSIFIGLLLNVLVLLFDVVRGTSKRSLKLKVVNETLANVAYAILLSLLTILVSLTTQITRWPFLLPYTSFITYALACSFVANLLMIVKRIYALFLDEVKEEEGPRDRVENNMDLDDWVPLS